MGLVDNELNLDEVEKLRQRERGDDLRQLMSTASGRRFAYYLVYELGLLNEPSFDPSIKHHGDLVMARNEGIRETSRVLFKRLTTETPDEYELMMVERFKRGRDDRKLLELRRKRQEEQRSKM